MIIMAPNGSVPNHSRGTISKDEFLKGATDVLFAVQLGRHANWKGFELITGRVTKSSGSWDSTPTNINRSRFKEAVKFGKRGFNSLSSAEKWNAKIVEPVGGASLPQSVLRLLPDSRETTKRSWILRKE